MSSPVHTTASAHLDDTGDARVEQTLALIKTLVGSLPPRDRHQFLRDIADAVRPLSAPRAGEVLGAIVHILPQRKLWSVADLKKQIDEQGVSASAKEVYNAIGYLKRKGRVRRIGYGNYIVDGVQIQTSDDFGGETTRNEDEYRTNRD